MPIDPNKIFNLFDGKGSTNSDYKKSTPLLTLDPKSFPYILGMFKKLILNYHNYSESIVKMLVKAGGDLNMDQIRESSEIMLYTQAYEYLLDLELDDENLADFIGKKQDFELKAALELALRFFENYEEYEKCIVVKKLLDFFSK